jgi:anthranilate phosphoribosyltransferase
VKEVLAKLAAGNDLAPAEMEASVATIMDGKATPAQIGAFLTALHIKGETIDELVAAVRVMRSRGVRVDAAGPLVDTCGTGGDGLGYFNISTASSFVVAAAGARVAKHGNRAASGKVGAADVLEALGADIEIGAEDAARAIDEVGIAFLFAPLYHPAVRHVAGPRRELGFRTLFNLIGPLANPAGATRQVLGLFSVEWLEPVARALAELGSEHALVVHGGDGSDEITPTTTTDVAELFDGQVRRWTIEPKAFGLARCDPSELDSGDAAASAAAIRTVLGGGSGAKADAVALNAGAGIYVAGLVESVADGVESARALMTDGRALSTLDAFVAFTQGLKR